MYTTSWDASPWATTIVRARQEVVALKVTPAQVVLILKSFENSYHQAPCRLMLTINYLPVERWNLEHYNIILQRYIMVTMCIRKTVSAILRQHCLRTNLHSSLAL